VTDEAAERFHQLIAHRLAADRGRVVQNADGTVSPRSWKRAEDWLRATADLIQTPDEIAAQERLFALMDAGEPLDVIDDAIAHLIAVAPAW
jgi:hypothetical protein